ncbi:Putative aminopeptidase FrvX [Methylomagnum ishizawai]|uniref:Aminopeptidase FrvX n=1 Tax=Methylomagnum ishizawai TaxID=1760988 RepID=A0A1Y6CV28_9GAMM|nr:M20/M25/M40 family metallo-hydrolase [Methylomagnum ishizawai]SMF94488.1 Putative aminopeptidase FrvX [Methylomagnum ishizawai]
MSDPFRERLFRLIADLVLCHSPSGAEQEIDAYLLAWLGERGIPANQDAAGNIIVRIPGRDGSRRLAITAHKDEIGGIVKGIRDNGRIEVRKLGGAFPWVWGEGVVDLLGDRATLPGILSFGSRHVSHESPQKVYEEERPPRWETVWVDCKCSRYELAEAGIRPGTRVVVGKHRKQPFRLGDDYIASYALDNKAVVAVLLLLAESLRHPGPELSLVFSSKEEVGGIGALYFTQRNPIDELIALDIAPKSSEYPIVSDRDPVLLSQDSYGMYDEALNARLKAAAREAGFAIQHAILCQFGTDASVAMKWGHVPRAACLGFPADNTHGYEIAHFGALEACFRILETYGRT